MDLSGKVFVIGIVLGWCFVGNVALLGMIDVIIVIENSNIGMVGFVLIEVGGFGFFLSEEVGFIDV